MLISTFRAICCSHGGQNVTWVISNFESKPTLTLSRKSRFFTEKSISNIDKRSAYILNFSLNSRKGHPSRTPGFATFGSEKAKNREKYGIYHLI
jgi:hypothetical protein